jgi:hypothetical protein
MRQTYQCDSCLKTTELDNFLIPIPCFLTPGCHGFIAPTILSVTNTANTEQQVERNVLYVHHQKTPESVWQVQHNLASHNIIIVEVDRLIDGKKKRVILNKDEYQLIKKGTTLQIIFSDPNTGAVQILANDTSKINPKTDSEPETRIVSTNGVLTIALSNIIANDLEFDVPVTVIEKTGSQIRTTITFTKHIPDQVFFNTPWKHHTKCYLPFFTSPQCSIYSVRTVDLFNITGIEYGNEFVFDDEVVVLLSQTNSQSKIDANYQEVVFSSAKDVKFKLTNDADVTTSVSNITSLPTTEAVFD